MQKSSQVVKAGLRGGVKIDVSGASDAWILATGGSINVTKTRPSSSAIDMPMNKQPRSEFLVSLGTEQYTGSVNFDLTPSALPFIKEIATKRNVQFKITFAMPEDDSSYSLAECYMQSLNLNGSANGIISGSVSFISRNKWRELGKESASKKDIMNKANYEPPLAYWYSGGDADDDIKDWSLNVSQDAKAIYGNTLNDTLPLYIRCGNLKFDLTVTTYFKTRQIPEIRIGNTKFLIKQGVTTSETINFSPSDVTMATHVFTGYSSLEDGNVGTVFEVN